MNTELTKEIKNDIAEYFISDCKEFLFRYKKLREFQTQISNRSKLMIDLIFAIECSLKALIFIESNEDEKETYKKIKTHNLKKLIEKVDNTEILEIVNLINLNIELFDVSSRYTLEANINFRENNVLGELYYNTIANFIWLDNLYKSAQTLLSFVETKMNRKVEVINFNNIDMDKEIEKGNRINSISEK